MMISGLSCILAMASIFTAGQSQQPTANYSWSDSGGLLAAKAQGSFNTSGAQPVVYSLRQPLVFSAPTFELVGSAADASSVHGEGTAIRMSYCTLQRMQQSEAWQYQTAALRLLL